MKAKRPRNENERQRAAFLLNLPRLCRHAIDWSGRLVRIGTPVERSYLDERKAATLVRKQYGRAGTKPVKISRAHQRELSAEDRDPKTLQSVEAYFADFGKEEPWARFYAALQTWLTAAHARHPIELTERPTARN